ncbi:MAG: hypothetical protein AAGI07_13015 [Bacteroidota bacterium]
MYKLFLLSVLYYLSYTIQAQDILYRFDGSFEKCKVLSLDHSKIYYKKIANMQGPAYSGNLENFAFAFFETGYYVTFPHVNTNGVNFKGYIPKPYDIIITANGEVFAANINSVENSMVRYKMIQNVEGPTYTKTFQNLTALIYSSGKHALIKSPKDAYEILKLARHKINALEGSAVVDVMSNDVKMVNTSNRSTDSSIRNHGNNSDINFNEFKEKSLSKINDFSTYLGIIASRQTDPAAANNAIDLAISLFVNEESMVEVSSAKRKEVISHPIRVYLGRLKLLKYDKIEITWADINYVSDFRLSDDGNYYGTVSLKQTFKGFIDGEEVYSDITEKQIEVVLKGFEKEVGGKATKLWDVLLSDIGVMNTRS